MKEKTPKVSVSMLAYNVGKFIGAAIEGVLSQQVDFSIELVIGEDCSQDNTRELCDGYAARFPDLIKLLPSDINRGIAGNTSRVWQHCAGEYIAICDSDDIWTDPYKLRNQVKFLDENPSYGAVYSDVEIITATGEIGDNDGYDRVRRRYTSGRVFSQLLKGNFINNSTGVFRKSLIEDYKIDEDKTYYSYDYLFWLNIACQSEIHYLNARTTSYRRHTGGVTTSDLRLGRNREKFLHYLPSLLIKFDECRSGSLTNEEKVQIFRKKLSVIYRKEADLKMKWKILQLMPRYFPGLRGVISILTTKYLKDDASGDRKKISLNS